MKYMKKIRIPKVGNFFPTYKGKFSGKTIYKGFLENDWQKGMHIDMFKEYYFPGYKAIAMEELRLRIDREVEWNILSD